ncbi:Eukaryotic elongation factor 2 kinase [Rhizophlyctis rosea]|nr:Eukaryotic elongation factor 2 kinase [Rhizophlyctis rosea]
MVYISTERTWYAADQFLFGTFGRHSSNDGGVNTQNYHRDPPAFSHFSFEYSKGAAVVMDIQGVGDTWTDPVINSMVPNKTFGIGNGGAAFIEKFKKSHVCNSLCRNLGLTPLNANGPNLHSSIRPSATSTSALVSSIVSKMLNLPTPPTDTASASSVRRSAVPTSALLTIMLSKTPQHQHPTPPKPAVPNDWAKQSSIPPSTLLHSMVSQTLNQSAPPTPAVSASAVQPCSIATSALLRSKLPPQSHSAVPSTSKFATVKDSLLGSLPASSSKKRSRDPDADSDTSSLHRPAVRSRVK